jgi:large subunit ribosomal protein L27
MAHTKAKGSTKLGRESESKRLGVKLYAGETAKPGDIIIRQRGTKYAPGANVKLGSDDTIYAMKNGIVRFSDKRKTGFDGSKKKQKVVSVI